MMSAIGRRDINPSIIFPCFDIETLWNKVRRKMIKSLTFSTKSDNYAGFYYTFLVAYTGRDSHPGRVKDGQPGYDWRGNCLWQIPAGIKAGASAGHSLYRADIQED